MDKKKYNLGIALGGGGARGFAHLGVLQALKEKDIKPDIISGVSAGAIVGAFIADGKQPREVLEIMKKYNFSGMARLTRMKNGLLSLSKMKSSLDKHIQTKKIQNLDLPLIITVSNMLEGNVEYISKGPLSKLVQASASIPILFKPVEYKGSLYNDGGIFDNLPVKPLKGKCKKIIAVSISPIQKIDDLKNLKETAIRMFQLAVNLPVDEIGNNSDLCIEPPELSKFDVMDTKNADKIFDIGYQYVKNMEISL
ncbi:MAG: patatin-like phospholipase family protein [Bacteroidota bacterium]